MLDERDYCAINVNHNVESFGKRIKPKQKMNYPKLNCFWSMRRRVQLTHTNSDEWYKFSTRKINIFLVNMITSSMYCDWLTVDVQFDQKWGERQSKHVSVNLINHREYNLQYVQKCTRLYIYEIRSRLDPWDRFHQ